jgi:glutaredoxin-like protein NrdH
VDIIENKAAGEKIKQLGYQTVPVVVIHAEPETSWSGFRPDVLEGEFL